MLNLGTVSGFPMTVTWLSALRPRKAFQLFPLAWQISSKFF